MPDLNRRELVVLAPLAVLMIVLGVMPQPFLAVSEPATEHLMETIQEKRMAALVPKNAQPDSSGQAAQSFHRWFVQERGVEPVQEDSQPTGLMPAH